MFQRILLNPLAGDVMDTGGAADTTLPLPNPADSNPVVEEVVKKEESTTEKVVEETIVEKKVEEQQVEETKKEETKKDEKVLVFDEAAELIKDDKKVETI